MEQQKLELEKAVLTSLKDNGDIESSFDFARRHAVEHQVGVMSSP